MAIPFSRSMRSLQADKARLSWLGLVGATLLLIAWTAWFFLAPMTIYETGKLVSLTASGTIVADFPRTAAGRVQRGQSAVLQSATQSGEPSSLIAAMVIDVSAPSRNERVQVTLYPRTRTTVFSPPAEGPVGQARVAVGRISPAALFLGKTGLSPSASRSSLK